MEIILGLILGIGSIVVAILGLLFAYTLSRRTDALIKGEDRIAKQMIEEGNKRTQQMLERTQYMIEEGNKRAEQMIERTQEIIEEGNKRTQQMIERTQEMIERMEMRNEEAEIRTQRLIAEIHSSTSRILDRILERVG